MAEHDQRLKTLLKEFVLELLALLFPMWIGRFDVSTATWLEQEVFVDPPHGERRELDLVAQLGVQPPINESATALFHLEVESGDSVAELRTRMPRYHDLLHYKHDLPVLSAAVYLDVALQGEGWDEAREVVWDETVGTRRWRYLGLPGLDARRFLDADNLLGVAFSVKMRIEEEQRGWLKARALQRIATAELTEYRRHLLMEFIDAYRPLEGPHLEQFNHLLLTPDFKEARMLAKTTFELGMEKGRADERRAIIREMLEAQFGELSETVIQRLEAMDLVRLRQLGRDLRPDKTLGELGLEDAPASGNGG